MSPALYEFVSIDLPPLLAGTLASLACGLLGNFLVLRRMSLVGDAISHAILPGLVLAFILTGSRAPLPMFLGAAAAGLVTVLLIELLKRHTRIEPGAAMGVVFSVLFALGVLLLERGGARQVDLDADCVLNGVLETLFWLPPTDPASLLTWSTLADLPRQVWTLAIVATVVLLFVTLLFKELRIACFDPGLASSQGFPAGLINTLLMVLVAATCVASFEAVGSILVIAMLICPAASARMLTDRLGVQVALSGLISLACGVGGYLLGAFGPGWVGLEGSVSAAGMIAVLAGLFLGLATLFAPVHGVLARRIRRVRFSLRIAREDMLAALYRADEQGRRAAPAHEVLGHGHARPLALLALRIARSRRQVEGPATDLRLTEIGRAEARAIIRSHRQWETYLVDRGGLAPDHVHDAAMVLEHVRAPRSDDRLAPDTGVARDPHDRPIP